MHDGLGSAAAIHFTDHFFLVVSIAEIPTGFHHFDRSQIEIGQKAGNSDTFKNQNNKHRDTLPKDLLLLLVLCLLCMVSVVARRQSASHRHL